VTLERIYRYPVKGLPGEALDTVSLAVGQGLPHDRRFAIARGDTRPADAPKSKMSHYRPPGCTFSFRALLMSSPSETRPPWYPLQNDAPRKDPSALWVADVASCVIHYQHGGCG
jgi:hypothetical protein